MFIPSLPLHIHLLFEFHTFNFIHSQKHLVHQQGIFIHLNYMQKAVFTILLWSFFALFTVLTFTLLVQKQWWVKLLVPLHKSNQWHWAALISGHWCLCNHTHIFFKCSYHLKILDETVKNINFVKSLLRMHFIK